MPSPGTPFNKPFDNGHPTAPPISTDNNTFDGAAIITTTATPVVVNSLPTLKQAFMNGQLTAIQYEQANQQLAHLKQAFINKQMSVIEYEQAEQQLFAQLYSSSQHGGVTPTATAIPSPFYQPQPQIMTRNNFQPQQMRQQQAATSPELEAQIVDGVLTLDNPLPCVAYIFMLPFPFLCMGCCLFSGSKILFDDRTRQMTINTWNGVGLCRKSWVGGYEQIISFDVEATSTSINNVQMYTGKVAVRDDAGMKEFRFGMESYARQQQKVQNLNAFMNVRRAR